jgi:hypothetical protein
MKLSKFLLLQTAAPDAIVRLEQTTLTNQKKVIENVYFKQQHHSSIEDFLIYHVHECDAETALLMQVCTYNCMALFKLLKIRNSWVCCLIGLVW